MAKIRITKKLIDRAGELEALIAPLAAELAEIKASVKERGDGAYLGHYYTIEVSTSQVTALSAKLAKAVLTPAQIEACSTTSDRTRVSVRDRQVPELRVAA